MDVFDLQRQVVSDYEKFTRSFTTIRAEDLRVQVEALYADGRFWPEPLIQINPRYKLGRTVAELAGSDELHPACLRIFRADGQPLHLFKHQEQSVALAGGGESFVVTTGTGSGKSLCFFIPIVHAVLSEGSVGEPRTRAVVVYPMNALANSQMEELEKFLSQAGNPAPITFGRYTGQDDREERQAIADHAPDILLTNFMMLELLMTRQDELDQKVIGNCAGLRFLVLDEFHTYRGRQGADVALLVRRVRDRLAGGRLQCIGTSATMASGDSAEEKARVIAEVASRLFAAPIAPYHVISETLERTTDPEQTADSVAHELAPVIEAGFPDQITDAELARNPLVIWVETRLGLDWSTADNKWVRARPQRMTDAIGRLAQESGGSEGDCRAAIEKLLLLASRPERERMGGAANGRPGFFAFKLHQFISGAGHAYATLDPVGHRAALVEGQQFLPQAPEKRLYATHFCRECGQEYHPVRLVKEEGGFRVLARDIDDTPIQSDDTDADDAAEEFGYLMLDPGDADFRFQDEIEDYPEAWLDFDAAGIPRLKPLYRKKRSRRLLVEPTGLVGCGQAAWFTPGKFRLCLRCATNWGTQGKDNNRLASLSAEGRSSATTVLVMSVLNWLHKTEALPPEKRKLLSFTDNRQDAALQSGHFNDFLFVSLLRGGIYGALSAAGPAGLAPDRLGEETAKALGFDRAEMRPEWLAEPGLRGLALTQAQMTLRETLTYRGWFDQRRGWRYTNPNLEQLGLLAVYYPGLDELADDEELFAAAPEFLRTASPVARKSAYFVLFDYLRQGLAIDAPVLEKTALESLKQRGNNMLRVPWGFGRENPRSAAALFTEPPRRADIVARDEEIILRGGSRSLLGRRLRTSRSWDGDARARAMKPTDYLDVLAHMLSAARTHGLVVEVPTAFDDTKGWRLHAGAVLFQAAEPILGRGDNPFFRDLYRTLAAVMREPESAVFRYEAREHTAQVRPERRIRREQRFRFGAKDRDELANAVQEMREYGEPSRLLPVLVCSPTMELGVDISALNTVYLRNVPPTPANYAQRSGRAGRSGQPALVLTYCAARSPHDQYFFRDPPAMVHGEVRAPMLDLANRDLVESHLHAIWLAETGVKLAPSIAEILELGESGRPVRPTLMGDMRAAGVEKKAHPRMTAVLGALADEFDSENAPWFAGAASFAEEVTESAARRFERAFDRWRDLLIAAERQRDLARRIMDDHAAPKRERDDAKSRHDQAIQQIRLLEQGTESTSSDFYTYRFLATEGFLPGYNFPRLPLMAFIPGESEGRRQTYLQRPRFLALSEFGPRSLVYHEGRAFRVDRAMLAISVSDTGANGKLPTRYTRICRACGAGHFDDHDTACQSCGALLGDAEIVRDLFRIENVSTRLEERITANDEERQRQGFELQTTFEWAVRDGVRDRREAMAADPEGPILAIRYGAAARITRINKGLRRRQNKNIAGFWINPISGRWARSDDEGADYDGEEGERSRRQRIVPYVEDRKNLVLIEPLGHGLSARTLATLQHALSRGIEIVFQLEESELFGEPVPSTSDRKGFLLYEAAEGGAGVLSRLVAEPETFRRVARSALGLLHFDLPDDDAAPMPQADALVDRPGTACVAACYRCLLSYYNQPDHELSASTQKSVPSVFDTRHASTARLT